MTASFETAPPRGAAAFLFYDTGAGDVAVRVHDITEKTVLHYFEPRLRPLSAEIADAVAESRDAANPVDRETELAALRFASLLPRLAPSPEVSSDPDGEIAFDWFGPSRKMFSVSVNKSGRLSYAGWFREDIRVHGTEELVDGFPEAIIRGIQRAAR